MPRKPAVAKKTTAKKATSSAKKSAPAKKTTAKKPAAKDSSASDDRTNDGLAKKIVTAIKAGEFDGHISDFDNAVSERIEQQRVENAKKKTPAKKGAESKKVSAAPKRESITPEPNKSYKVSSRFKKLAGAKVKFIRFKAEDDTKGVVEMMVDKPGYPKGKRAILPVSVLTK